MFVIVFLGLVACLIGLFSTNNRNELSRGALVTYFVMPGASMAFGFAFSIRLLLYCGVQEIDDKSLWIVAAMILFFVPGIIGVCVAHWAIHCPGNSANRAGASR